MKPADKVIRTYCPLVISKDMIDACLGALESVLQDKLMFTRGIWDGHSI